LLTLTTKYFQRQGISCWIIEIEKYSHVAALRCIILRQV